MPTGKARASLGAGDTSSVPFRVTDEIYIPRERYTSQEFHDLERERLWPHAWQVAAREEEIPRPGDFVEYTITDYSILVVRTQTGEVRAFHNACRHRATALGQGCGSFPTGRIVCPFHGWQYDLEGKCTYIFAPEGFRSDSVAPGEVALSPVKAERKWGMVWVNLDPNAPSLDEYLGVIVDYVDPLQLGKMRVTWWKQVRLEANWKIAQEAFFEGYHIMQSHPEMALFTAPDNYSMERMEALNPRLILQDRGHWAHHADVFMGANAPVIGSIIGGRSNVDLLVMRNRAHWLGSQAAIPERVYKIQEELLAAGTPIDDNFPGLLMEKVIEDAKARNIPLKAPTPKSTTWAHVFPNLTFLEGYGSVLMYRSRPAKNDPNACIYDFWSIELVPEGTEMRRPTQASDEFFFNMWVVQQDKGNIERQQVGLRTQNYKENRLATNYEETISSFHLYLDQVLAQEPA